MDRTGLILAVPFVLEQLLDQETRVLIGDVVGIIEDESKQADAREVFELAFQVDGVFGSGLFSAPKQGPGNPLSGVFFMAAVVITHSLVHIGGTAFVKGLPGGRIEDVGEMGHKKRFKPELT